MAPEVLISKGDSDREAADQICDRLEDTDIECWIAPRNMTAGMNCGRAIVEAIEKVKIILVLVSRGTSEGTLLICSFHQVFQDMQILANNGLPSPCSNTESRGCKRAFRE